MILVDASGLRASRPGKPLFDDLSLTIASGDRVGIVGLNGCGKSTLMRFLAGADEPEAGVVRRGRDAHVAFLDQQAELPPGTVREVVGPSWEAAAVLDRLGMTPLIDRPTTELSGGQRKRVALARALLGVENAEHDLLLLDEPTNHLDVDAIAWLQDRLARFRGGLVLVTHDRHLLDAVTNKVIEIDRGATYLHVASGATGGSGYQAYLEGRALREEQFAESERARRGLARRELAWLRRGAPARTSKPKARIDAATALISGPDVVAGRSGELSLGEFGSQRLGSKVLELHDVGHRWGDGPWLFRHLDLIIEPGDRLGIAGLNGAGKSTLLEIIAGRLAPAEGHVEQGTTVNLGYYDQTGVELDLEMRVREAVAGPHRNPDHTDAALLRRFWFDDDAHWAPIGLLSGGERRRLQLLMVLAAQPNVLLLDEPTNDLDLDTLRALEDLLEEWPGALVVVSHDRAFLERTVEHVVAIDPDRSGLVPGGYEGWMRRRREAAASTTAPAATSRPASSASKSAAPGRSASTLGRLMRDTEKEIERATVRRDRLAEELSTLTDHVRIAEIGTQLAAADAEIAAAEERWLELAAEAEARR